MEKLPNLVDVKIENRLSETFALVFDGWSQFETHYLSIVSTFPVQSQVNTEGRRYDYVLLDFVSNSIRDAVWCGWAQAINLTCAAIFQKAK